MSEGMIAALLAVIGAIFAAGKLFSSSEAKQEQTKVDVNRIGQQRREDEKNAARRYHNICMVLIASEDERDERFKIAGLLKED